MLLFALISNLIHLTTIDESYRERIGVGEVIPAEKFVILSGMVVYVL